MHRKASRKAATVISESICAASPQYPAPSPQLPAVRDKASAQGLVKLRWCCGLAVRQLWATCGLAAGELRSGRTRTGLVLLLPNALAELVGGVRIGLRTRIAHDQATLRERSQGALHRPTILQPG